MGCRPQSREVYIVLFSEKQEEKTIKKKTLILRLILNTLFYID